MEPQEINAGGFYLRALRSDERVDDLPAVHDIVPGAGDEYIQERVDGWRTGTLLTWAACRQTDVDLLAEVRCEIEGDTAVVTGWARPGIVDSPDALDAGLGAVSRFAEGALGLTVEVRE